MKNLEKVYFMISFIYFFDLSNVVLHIFVDKKSMGFVYVKMDAHENALKV